jgi:hypothetical protein
VFFSAPKFVEGISEKFHAFIGELISDLLYEMPDFARSSMVFLAPSTSSERLLRLPWSGTRQVAGGIVFTVSGPIVPTTYMTSRYLDSCAYCFPQNTLRLGTLAARACNADTENHS